MKFKHRVAFYGFGGGTLGYLLAMPFCSRTEWPGWRIGGAMILFNVLIWFLYWMIYIKDKKTEMRRVTEYSYLLGFLAGAGAVIFRQMLV